ncbi:hypothetical protein QTV49_000436 [Vibrio vulnificus]|nr:hypothetical protein [Vibrio vulnificus]
MNEAQILKCVKHMLSDKRSHAVMRMVILLLEKADKTTPENPLHLSSETKFLKRHFESVGVTEFLADLKELASISTQVMTSTKINSTRNGHTFHFSFDGISAFFSIPVREKKKLSLKKVDILEKDIQTVWLHWLEVVGSQKEIYKREPTLTKERRKWIRDGLVIATADELNLAIDGCIRSPFHMGYKIDEKLWSITKQKHYCEPCNIFRNRDKIENLITKCEDKNYLYQVEEANQRRSLRYFGGTDTALTDISKQEETESNESAGKKTKLELLMSC